MAIAKRASLNQHTVNTPLKLPSVPDPPHLSALHDLIGENWLGEQVIDAYGSLMATRLGPLITYIPSFNLFTMIQRYNDGMALNNTLKSIREDVLHRNPSFIAMVLNKSSCHWAAVLVSTRNRAVFHGDSLGFPPDENLVSVMKWMFDDVTDGEGSWTLAELPIAKQPAGSGSCGVISMDGIESFISGVLPCWSPEVSSLMRLRWMAIILHAHGRLKMR